MNQIRTNCFIRQMQVMLLELQPIQRVWQIKRLWSAKVHLSEMAIALPAGTRRVMEVEPATDQGIIIRLQRAWTYCMLSGQLKNTSWISMIIYRAKMCSLRMKVLSQSNGKILSIWVLMEICLWQRCREITITDLPDGLHSKSVARRWQRRHCINRWMT